MQKFKKWLSNKWVIVGLAAALVVVAAVIITLVVVNNKDNKSSKTTTSNSAGSRASGSTGQATGQTTPTTRNCVSDDCLAVDGLEYPAGKLPVSVSDAVKSALDDEYKVYSTYNAVVAKIGPVRPFSMIIRAEESHIASLKALLDKYGEQIPANPYEGKITVKDTRQEYCQIGVDAEIANIALYRDDLLKQVTDYPDITTVFTTLMEASRDKHLPAFQKCN